MQNVECKMQNVKCKMNNIKWNEKYIIIIKINNS